VPIVSAHFRFLLGRVACIATDVVCLSIPLRCLLDTTVSNSRVEKGGRRGGGHCCENEIFQIKYYNVFCSFLYISEPLKITKYKLFIFGKMLFYCCFCQNALVQFFYFLNRGVTFDEISDFL